MPFYFWKTSLRPCMWPSPNRSLNRQFFSYLGKEKLGILEGECYIFDESDGTEIEDDDALLSYEKGTVFIIGKQWKRESNQIDETVENCNAKKEESSGRESVESPTVEENRPAKSSAEMEESEQDSPRAQVMNDENYSGDREAGHREKEEYGGRESVESPGKSTAEMEEENYDLQTEMSLEAAREFILKQNPQSITQNCHPRL